jgi:hypothetical protein
MVFTKVVVFLLIKNKKISTDENGLQKIVNRLINSSAFTKV